MLWLLIVLAVLLWLFVSFMAAIDTIDRMRNDFAKDVEEENDV